MWAQRELADFLFVSPATVGRMAQAGVIPCVVLRTGRRKKIVRFKRADIEKWLAQRTRPTASDNRASRKTRQFGNAMATESRPLAQLAEVESEISTAH
jgi:excisionase family DNA binding protein